MNVLLALLMVIIFALVAAGIVAAMMTLVYTLVYRPLSKRFEIPLPLTAIGTFVVLMTFVSVVNEIMM